MCHCTYASYHAKAIMSPAQISNFYNAKKNCFLQSQSMTGVCNKDVYEFSSVRDTFKSLFCEQVRSEYSLKVKQCFFKDICKKYNVALDSSLKNSKKILYDLVANFRSISLVRHTYADTHCYCNTDADHVKTLSLSLCWSWIKPLNDASAWCQ